jgi:hypothetical protein
MFRDAFLICSFLALCAPSFSQVYTFELDKWWYPNGTVNAVEVDDENGKIYVGGDFNEVSTDLVNCAWVDIQTGIPEFNPISPRGTIAEVYAVEEDEEGNTIVGGSFSLLGTTEANNLMRMNANGELDSWLPNVTGGLVLDLLLHDGILYVAGNFEAINGEERNGLASFDYETGLLTSWNPQLETDNSFPPSVRALEVSDERLYIGGSFDSVNGNDRSNVACFYLGNLNLVLEWNLTMNNSVSDLLYHDGILYMAGSFTSVSGNNRNRLAAVGATGFAPLTIWDPGANDFVSSIELYNDRIIVGGHFSSIDGSFRDGLASVNLTTGDDFPWNPIIEGGVVSDVMIASDTLYVCGSFNNVNGVDRKYVVSIDINSQEVTDWNPDIRGASASGDGINVVHKINSKIFVGGRFNTISPVERSDFYEVEASTGVATDWNPQFNGMINDICLTEEYIFVAGDFTLDGNPDIFNIAAFDKQTKELIDWTPSPDDEVRSLLEHEGILYLVGNFVQFDGAIRNRLVAVDLTTLEVTDWQPVADGSVISIDIHEDRVFITGGFNTINGTSREGIASINRHTGALNTMNASIPTGVGRVIKYHDGRLYIGGNFSMINGNVIEAFVSVSPISGAVYGTFNANLPTGESVRIYDIEIDNDRMFISGKFESIDGEDIKHLAEIDLLTGELLTTTPFQFSGPSSVRDIEIANNQILIGGFFETFTNEENFVAFGPVCLQPVITSVSAGSSTICPGQSTVLSISGGSLIGADGWFWYEGECGVGEPQTGQSISVSPGTTTTYYVRGEGLCPTEPQCFPITITVVPDEEPPFIPEPADSHVSVDPGLCTFSGTLVPPPATDNCGEISWTNDAPDQLPIGTTLVEWTAIDESGLSSVATQNIIVSDTENPIFENCPENQTIFSDQPDCSALASWLEPIATDNCTQELTLTSNLVPGDLLTFGLNEVSYTAIDESGNEAVCSFTVEVLSTISPSVMQENITCNGLDNGSISVSLEGDPSDVIIEWEGPMNFSSSAFELENLIPGNYTAELSQENGCTSTLEVEITEPEALMATATVSPVTFGDDGEISLTIVGGTAPYSFDWTGPEGFASNELNLTDLNIAGIYQVTITDDNGCMIDLEVELPSVVSTENSQEFEVSIFPNPVEKSLNLHVSPLFVNEKIELFDTQGRLLLSSRVESTEHVLDVSDLSKGTYILRIGGANQSFAIMKMNGN